MGVSTLSSYRIINASHSKADAAEKKNMVNSGARGTKDRNLRTEVGCTVKAYV
jgi:hypothetical protein